MSITKQVDILIKGRTLILNLIKDCSLDQINKIPEGFNNNIGWNVGHLVVTHQLLCYRMCGLECYIPNEMIALYKKGEAPNGHIIDQTEWDEIKKLLMSLPSKMMEDLKEDKFKTYTNYKTSANVTLDTFEDAVNFNNFHEGIHYGVLLGLKKLV